MDRGKAGNSELREKSMKTHGHVPCRFSAEGHGQKLLRLDSIFANHPGKTADHNSGLAGAGHGEQQQITAVIQNGLFLLLVKADLFFLKLFDDIHTYYYKTGAKTLQPCRDML